MSASPPPDWFLPVWCISFPLLWVVVTSVLRKAAGFSHATTKQHALPGRLDEERFVGAQIAKVRFSGCLHASRVPGGYLLRISRLFLGGSRFISDAEVSAMVVTDRWLLGQVLGGELANGDDFRAYGRLARYLITSRAASP